MSNPLLNAPPRISDLSLDERKVAMAARAEQHRRDWLANRTRRPLVQRILDWVR